MRLNNKVTAFFLLMSLASGIVFFTSCNKIEENKRQNVLFIIADDLNCNIGAYGHYLVKTPNIDALANEGVLFNNAFCNFPLCGPSRASMMTGLYPDQTGHYRLRDLIRNHVPDAITLSQNFINNGYTVARVGKIYHYNNPKDIGTPGHDDPASWNERYYPKGIDKEIEDEIFSLRPGSFGACLSWLAAKGEDKEHTDGMVATKSIELLKKYAKSDTPFFLGVGFYKPHTPFVAPKKYFDLYQKNKIHIPQVPNNYLSTLPKPAVSSLIGHKEQNNLPDSLALCAIQAYYATISFMDAQVGRVLNALDSLGLKENTIVIFTSDHGYHMGEHAYYQKKTLFEDSGKIPLIVSSPGIKSKGKASSSIIEMIDIYPTLSDLADITPPEYVAGKSFKNILIDPQKQNRGSSLTQIPGGYTLRTPDYRYTKWGKGEEKMVEFYERSIDPEELYNLAEDEKYKDKMNELDKLLNQRIEQAHEKPKGLKVINYKK